MDKLVAFLSLINLLVLEIGSFVSPDKPIMWLASTSIAYEITRAVLIFLLILLITTHPPRKAILRTLVGLISIAVLSAVVVLTFGYYGNMPVLDSLTLAAAGVAMGIMALEITDENEYMDIAVLNQTKRNKTHAH